MQFIRTWNWLITGTSSTGFLLSPWKIWVIEDHHHHHHHHPISTWLVVWTPLKNISQLGWLFPIYGKIKNVPNHQPAMVEQLNINQDIWGETNSLVNLKRATDFMGLSMNEFPLAIFRLICSPKKEQSPAHHITIQVELHFATGLQGLKFGRGRPNDTRLVFWLVYIFVCKIYGVCWEQKHLNTRWNLYIYISRYTMVNLHPHNLDIFYTLYKTIPKQTRVGGCVGPSKRMVCTGVTIMHGAWSVTCHENMGPGTGDPHRYGWWRFALISTCFLVNKPWLHSQPWRRSPIIPWYSRHDWFKQLPYFWWVGVPFLGWETVDFGHLSPIGRCTVSTAGTGFPNHRSSAGLPSYAIQWSAFLLVNQLPCLVHDLMEIDGRSRWMWGSKCCLRILVHPLLSTTI